MGNRIPRLDPGRISGGVPSGAGAITPAQMAAPTDALGRLADVGMKIAGEEEMAWAEKQRRAREAKQAVVNEVEAGRRASEYEEQLFGAFEKLKVDYADNPTAVPDRLLELGREQIGKATDESVVSNAAVGLAVAQRANSRLDSVVQKAHEWVVLRQTQKIKADTEGEKSILAAKAARLGSVRELEAHIAGAFERLTPQLEAIHGVNVDMEKREFAEWMTEGFVRGRMPHDPVGIKQALESAGDDVLGEFLKPGRRAELIEQAKTSIERRGREREYELVVQAAGKNREAVDLLNQGRLDVETVMSLQRENQKAIEAARLPDPTYTPEQRANQLKALEKQRDVLGAIESIRLRGAEYDPVEQSDADETARIEVDTALRKYKGSKEFLPQIVDQLDRLVFARRAKTITAGAFRAQFDRVNKAYEKAIAAESDNTGLMIGQWDTFVDVQEAGNRQMNELLRLAVNKPKSVQYEAWTEYQRRMNAAIALADKTGTRLSNDEARKIARLAFSYKTGIDKRIRGEE